MFDKSGIIIGLPHCGSLKKGDLFRAVLMATVCMAAVGGARAQSADDAATLEPIVVEGAGEAADGPVKGYVAKRSKTATKTDVPLEKTPQSVSVVTADQMADQGVKSVAEALRYTPGLFAEYRGASNLHDETFLRGYYYAPRFLDGLLFGSNSLGQIDPYLLERVEVLKGPSSVLYGEARPGGLINLVSKRPTGEASHEVQATVGTDGRVEGAFDLADKVPGSDTLSYRLVGKAARADTMEDGLDTKRLAVAPSIMWQPDNQTKVTVQAFYQNEPEAGFRNFREAKGSLTPTAYGYIPRDFLVSDPNVQKSEREQASIGYQAEHRFDNGVTLRQNARVTDIDTAYQTLTWGSLQADGKTITRTGSGGTEDMLQFVIDNSAEVKVSTGPLEHTVIGGFDYRYSVVDYAWGYDYTVPSIDWTNPVYNVTSLNLSSGRTDTKTKASQAGLYLQDQIEIGRLNLLFGGRQDWATTDIDDNLTGTTTSFDSSATTGRAGAVYDLGLGFSPYVSVATSFEPVLTAAPTGSDPFDPSTAIQYEAGVRFAPEGYGFSVSAAVYELTQQNVLYRETSSSPWQQTGEIRTRGFELEGRAEITDNFSVLAAYSYTDQEVTEAAQANIVGKTPARIPLNQASIWGKYEFSDGPLNGLGLGLGLRYIGESWGDATNTFKVPDTLLLDASVSYDFGALDKDFENVSLQVNATNLTDEFYTASCASAYACFVGAGRSVTATLKYKW